jgi:hypothetical protein
MAKKKEYISEHILREEARCKDDCGRANFTPSYKRKWERMRTRIENYYGRPVKIVNTNLTPGRNGGNRCAHQNRVADGAPGSKHKVWIKEDGEWGGIAGDWKCYVRTIKGDKWRMMRQGEFAWWGREEGFKGIGIYRGNVHLDTRKTKRVVKWPRSGKFLKPRKVSGGPGV